MVMPHILSAGRFIVLARRNSVALVGDLHRNSNVLGTCVNICCKWNRQIIDIFIVYVRNNNYMAKVIGRIIQTHKGRDSIVLEDKFSIPVGCNLADDSIEWTEVAFKSVIVHNEHLKRGGSHSLDENANTEIPGTPHR